MQVKRRVLWATKEIVPCATNREMAAAMDPWTVAVAVDVVIELAHRRLCQHVSDVALVVEVDHAVIVQVTRHAVWVRLRPVCWQAREDSVEVEWLEVDDMVGERPSRHAASSATVGKLGARRCEVDAGVGIVQAIATKRSW